MPQPSLSSAEIVAMRLVSDGPLPDVATVRRATESSDGEGGTTQTWSTIATIMCRVGVIGATGGQTSEEISGGQIAARSGIIITFQYNADVRSTDKVVVGGRTLEVIEPLTHSYQVGLQVIAKDVT